MKIKREARTAARKLFRACSPGGQLDEKKLGQVVDELVDAKPRNYLAILTQLQRLAQISTTQRTHSVKSAVELSDRGASVLAELAQKHGKALKTEYAVDPSLLGGLKLQVGSTIWDYSVRGKLDQLQQSLN